MRSPSPHVGRARAYRSPAPQPSIAQLDECFIYRRAYGDIVWRVRPLRHFEDLRAWASFNARYAGKPAITGSQKGGYRAGRVTIAGIRYAVRRAHIVWALHHGAWPELEIGHRNQDFGDDRLENLREQTESQKASFGRARQGVRSGFKGVWPTPSGRFVASVGIDGVRRHLGTFRQLGDAIEARNAAALVCHGEFARLAEAPATTAG